MNCKRLWFTLPNTDVFQRFFSPKSPIFNKSLHIVNDVVGKYSALFNNCHLNELSPESGLCTGRASLGTKRHDAVIKVMFP